MRQVKTHEPLVGSHDSLVYLQVGRASGETLHVDTPLVRVEVESFESAGLAQQLDGVDVLVATVVSCAGVALGVFVGHGRAQGVEDGARGNILGSDEDDGLSLALDLEFLGKSSQGLEWISGLSRQHTMMSATSESVSIKDFSNSCKNKSAPISRPVSFDSRLCEIRSRRSGRRWKP